MTEVMVKPRTRQSTRDSVTELRVAALASWIIAAISAGGYLGVAALMAIESACVPLPSEIIMPFAGYLASTGRFSLWGAALAGAIGCNVGSALAYFVGSRGGRPAIERFGRYVLLDVADLDRAERFFGRFGAPAVLVGRLLPVVRTFIALPAGMGRMKLLPFHALTFVGSFVWCYALALVGDELGAAWESDPRIAAVLHRFDALILVVLLAAAALFVWTRLRRRRPLHAKGELD
jgi:membrane protein DedA with SNARE-associated domain